MHYSVLLEESIKHLNLKENSIIVDCTLGYAGHSSRVLKEIKKGFLFAFDQDDEAIKYSKEKLDKIADNYEILAEMGFYKQRLGLEIRKYETPFIQTDCDNIENIHLAQFYWDLTYWLSFPHLAGEELAIKIGLHYFNSEIEKSNVYLISTLIKRLSLNYKDFPTLLERLGELAKKPSLSGFKFFSEEDESDKEFFAGKVQVMTMHKSKGDEFDYVFIPEMSEKNLTLDIDQMKLKGADFTETLKRLNPNYKQKTEDQMKEEQIAEHLRLLYVAITRARKQLYFTTSRKIKSFDKILEQEPNTIFGELLHD